SDFFLASLVNRNVTGQTRRCGLIRHSLNLFLRLSPPLLIDPLLDEGRVRGREDVVCSTKAGCVVEQMSFARRRPGAWSRGCRLLDEGRAHRREDVVCSTKGACIVEKMSF